MSCQHEYKLRVNKKWMRRLYMIMIIWNATDPTAESDYIKRTRWLVGVQNSEHFSPTVWLKQLHSNCMLYSLHNTRWYWQLRELQRTFKQQNTVKDKTAETPNKRQIAWKKERNTQNTSCSIICPLQSELCFAKDYRRRVETLRNIFQFLIYVKNWWWWW